MSNCNSFALRAAVALAAASLLAGCSAFQIYNSKGDKQQGVLINVKKPVTMHTTQWSLTVMSVQVEITKPDKKTVLARYPDTPLQVASTPATREAVQKLGAYIESQTKEPPDFTLQLDRYIADISQAAQQDAKNNRVSGLMTANTRGVEVVITPEQYYYNANVPLFGSITATVKLNQDGTLSETTANIQDKTAETLLSLVPVKDLVSKALLRSTKFEAAFVDKIVNLKLGDGTATITLKKIVPAVADASCPDEGYAALDLGQGLRGENCVQLVSYVVAGDKGGGGANKKAYQINGQIVPPEADK